MMFCAAALGANPATQESVAPDADALTPQAALRQADLDIRQGGMEKALAFYHTTTVRDREMARCLAGADVSCAHLEDALVQKFGRPAADQALHAIGAKTNSDIDGADVKIRRNTAVVNWPHDDNPLHMIKSGGDWKVDVAAELSSLNEREVHAFADFLKHFAVSADRLAEQLAAGRFNSAQEATTACRQARELLLSNDH
jgi:hypothetical protein